MRVLKNDNINQYGRWDTTNEDKLIYQETSLTFNFINGGFFFSSFHEMGVLSKN